MASIIRIKRSEVAGNPGVLGAGELAYSALQDNGSNGGDRLYIGIGTETAGNAVNHLVIGGKFFTDRLDHAAGVLTADSALVVDSDKKLDQIKIDNIDINGNTISTTDTNGNLLITPNGTGKTIITNPYIGDSDTSLAEYIQDITGGAITEGEGIDVAYDDNTTTVTISAEIATSSNRGIASFDIGDFTVTDGEVVLNAERIEDIVGLMVNGGTQNGISVAYDDDTGKLDFDLDDWTLTVTGDVDGSAVVTNNGNTSIALTLDTVNETTGTFGSTTEIPVITVNGKGLVTEVTTVDVATTLGLAADTGTDALSLLTDTLNVAGGEGIDTAINPATNTLTISAEVATSSNLGVATFNTASFDVTSGDVTIKTGGVSNTQLANSTVTFGSTEVALGGTSTAIAGVTQLDVDNIQINGNTISSTDANGDIVLDPNGTGVIDVSSTRITNLAEPTADSDAATKYYVDAARTGLDVKASVKAATTEDITLSNTQTVDGVSLSVGDRVLVKNQSNGTENGIYVVASGSWTRSSDADNTPSGEVTPGLFTFVEQGSVNGDCGFVLTNNGTIVLGTTELEFTLFSASGTLIAGNGLSKNGYTLEVNVASTGGIEIVGDNLQLKSSLAGNGLTITNGVLDVIGTTDRISVTANAIDIANTYIGQTSITTLGTITTGTWTADNIAANKGGTGIAEYVVGDLLYASGTAALSKLNKPSSGTSLLIMDTSGTPSWADLTNTGITGVGTITTGTWSATTIATNKGGTGLTSYSEGDLLYANSSGTLSKLAAGAEGYVLQMNASGLPVWGDIDGGTY